MFRKQPYQTLTDDARCAEDPGAPLFIKVLSAGFLLLSLLRCAITVVVSFRAHAAPPEGSALENSTGGPIRVPRACGLNVLRTHTTISLSAANGSTLGCNTFAPLAARACASSYLSSCNNRASADSWGFAV